MMFQPQVEGQYQREMEKEVRFKKWITGELLKEWCKEHNLPLPPPKEEEIIYASS